MGKRKRGLYLLLRLNRWTLALAGGLCAAALLLVTVQAAAAPEESVAVPAVMYHAVLQDTSRHGRYTVSPQEFESDLQYLTSHGYTTVVMADLIAYTQGGTLPEKPVLITFDDGYYNNYVYAYPIAQQMGCRFVGGSVHRDRGGKRLLFAHRLGEAPGNGRFRHGGAAKSQLRSASDRQRAVRRQAFARRGPGGV